jgi:hypothetical protein
MTAFKHAIRKAGRRAVGGHPDRVRRHIKDRFAWGDAVAGQGETTERFTGLGGRTQRLYQAAVIRATAAAFKMIRDRSPVDTGAYLRSHAILVNGREVAAWPVPLRLNDTVLIRPDVPYARFLEQGQSPDAPEGIYEVVVTVLDREYPDLDVTLSYDQRSDGKPVPAIRIARARR